MEKRGWVSRFTQETNKTSRQEACTTYVGHRRLSILPKKRKHWGLPGRILEAKTKLVSLVGSALQMETQPEFERERETWGDQSFEELIPILYFPWSTFIHWDVMQKSRGVSSPDFYQSQVLHTNVYIGLRDVTSSSGQGACWQFMTLSLWQPVSQPGHLFLQRWLFLKQMPPK